MVHPGAAILLGNGGTEKTEFPHFRHDVPVENLVPVGFQHPCHQFALTVIMGRVTDHALVFGELGFQQQRIFPVESLHVFSQILSLLTIHY